MGETGTYLVHEERGMKKDEKKRKKVLTKRGESDNISKRSAAGEKPGSQKRGRKPSESGGQEKRLKKPEKSS